MKPLRDLRFKILMFPYIDGTASNSIIKLESELLKLKSLHNHQITL
jgi:hypothetical protein